MTTLFNCTFENNRLYDPTPHPPGNGADMVSVSGGTVEVAAAAAHDGSYGVKFTPTQGYRAWMMMACGGLRKLRQRFWIHPNSLSIATGNSFRICRNGHYDASWVAYDIGLGYASSSYYIYWNIYNGTYSSTQANGSSNINITNAWHRIETYYQTGSPGSMELWLDGVSQGSVSATNPDALVNLPALGVAGGPGFTISGSFYVDSWQANDDGTLIGA